MIILKIYVVDNTPNSQRAIEMLTKMLEDEFPDEYSLEIVDLLENPVFAQHDKIYATPAVVKVSPLPTKKIIGNLSTKEDVMAGLGLA